MKKRRFCIFTSCWYTMLNRSRLWSDIHPIYLICRLNCRILKELFIYRERSGNGNFHLIKSNKTVNNLLKYSCFTVYIPVNFLETLGPLLQCPHLQNHTHQHEAGGLLLLLSWKWEFALPIHKKIVGALRGLPFRAARGVGDEGGGYDNGFIITIQLYNMS